MEAIASRLEAIAIGLLLGWRLLLLDWRQSLVGWRPWLLGWRPLLLAWRPLLVGCRPLLSRFACVVLLRGTQWRPRMKHVKNKNIVLPFIHHALKRATRHTLWKVLICIYIYILSVCCKRQSEHQASLIAIQIFTDKLVAFTWILHLGYCP